MKSSHSFFIQLLIHGPNPKGHFDSVVRCFLVFVLFLFVGCGDPDAEGITDPTTDPAFLNVSARVTAAPAGYPRDISQLEVRSQGCSVSPERTETLDPQDDRLEVLHFVVADSSCTFSISKITLLSADGKQSMSFSSAEPLSISGDNRSVSGRLVSEDRTRTLIADFSTNFEGSFANSHASLVLLFGYESGMRGLGMELRRVDNNLAEDRPESERGVGLRIESMIAKRAPDGSGIIALEPRFYCYIIREGKYCGQHDLTRLEFIFIPEQASPPTIAQMNDAFANRQLVTLAKPDSLFGNGAYALVATPERLPVDNTPPTTLWLLVRSGESISAFEVNTGGLKIF